MNPSYSKKHKAFKFLIYTMYFPTSMRVHGRFLLLTNSRWHYIHQNKRENDKICVSVSLSDFSSNTDWPHDKTCLLSIPSPFLILSQPRVEPFATYILSLPCLLPRKQPRATLIISLQQTHKYMFPFKA